MDSLMSLVLFGLIWVLGTLDFLVLFNDSKVGRGTCPYDPDLVDFIFAQTVVNTL